MSAPSQNPSREATKAYDAEKLAQSLRAIATWSIPLDDPLGRAVLNEAADRIESQQDTGDQP